MTLPHKDSELNKLKTALYLSLPDQVAEDAIRRIDALIQAAETRGRFNENEILSAMEAAPQLAIAFEKYDGDMDWVEFVQKHYIKPRKAQLEGRQHED